VNNRTKEAVREQIQPPRLGPGFKAQTSRSWRQNHGKRLEHELLNERATTTGIGATSVDDKSIVLGGMEVFFAPCKTSWRCETAMGNWAQISSDLTLPPKNASPGERFTSLPEASRQTHTIEAFGPAMRLPD